MGCILEYNSIFIHTPVNEWHTYICPWYSQHAPSSPRLYLIISYVDAPCLWNIKMTMTGTILEAKQKVIWSSAHQ